MERHKEIQNKNILIETDNSQQLVNSDNCIQKEVDNNKKCIQEEFTDSEFNTDKYKHNNSNFCNVNSIKKCVNKSDTTVKIEKDVTVYNDYVFKTEIEMPKDIQENKKNIQVTEKNVHIAHPIENFRNHYLTVGGQILNDKNEYRCSICNKRFNDKYNLKVHKSLHANIKKLNCTTCDAKFPGLTALKNHLVYRLVRYIKKSKKQLLQQGCDDVGEQNNNLCNNISVPDGLMIIRSKDGILIQKRTTNKITSEFSEEIEQQNIENNLSTKVCSVNSYFTVGNSASVNDKHISLDESYNASSVGKKDSKNDEIYKCAKCSKLFHDRPSIIDHLKPHTDQCTNCCKYIGSQTSCKYPISFQPGEPVYFECDGCYNEFYALKTFEEYPSAQNNKEKDRPYKCDVCLKTYIHLYHFYAHQRLHKGERPYQCNICDKRFHDRFNLEVHVFSHQNIKSFECSLCSKKFLKSSYFKIHMLSHESNKHKCNMCGIEFESLNSLQKHQDLHPGYNKCILTDWKRHKKTHNDNIHFECNECHKKFTSKTGVKIHLQTHVERIKNHKCKVCNKTFLTNSNLYRHEKIHNALKKYVCKTCKKSFISCQNFLNHLNQHKDDEQYLCEPCDNIYPTIESLNTHKKTNHTCDICNKFFSDPRELIVHKTTHEVSKLKQYVCKFCDKELKNQRNLTYHELTHLAEKPHKCDFCPNSYTKRSVLEIHRRKHTSEMLYECILCNKTYLQSYSLNRHIATIHK